MKGARGRRTLENTVGYIHTVVEPRFSQIEFSCINYNEAVNSHGKGYQNSAKMEMDGVFFFILSKRFPVTGKDYHTRFVKVSLIFVTLHAPHQLFFKSKNRKVEGTHQLFFIVNTLFSSHIGVILSG